MKKIYFLASMMALFAAVSCTKDKAVTPPPVTPEPATKLLTKITKKEFNVTTVFNFVYDGNKRLQSFKSTDNKVGVSFSYDAAGNLVGIDDVEDNFHNIYTYTYNNNKPVSGTFKSWKKTAGTADALIEDDQLSYTVENNRVSKIHIAFQQTGDAADFTLAYSAAGNLQTVSSAANNYSASFTCGNRKPVFPAVTNYVLDQAGFSFQFAARNELLTISYDFPGNQYDKSVTTQYTYDASGYVLTSNDGSAQISYEYL